jgi:hypothetical protein
MRKSIPLGYYAELWPMLSWCQHGGPMDESLLGNQIEVALTDMLVWI